MDDSRIREESRLKADEALAACTLSRRTLLETDTDDGPRYAVNDLFAGKAAFGGTIDLRILVDFGVSLWMYATPVVYPLSTVSDALRRLLRWNPVTPVMFLTTCQLSSVMVILIRT